VDKHNLTVEKVNLFC